MAIAKSTAVYDTPYIQWSSVFAGAAVALAITLILVPFGNAIGLSLTAPLSTLTAEKARGVVFGIGLWVFWTQLISSIFGGYFAGKSVRSAETGHEGEFRDGVHGLLSWSVGTIVTSAGAAISALIAAWAPHHGYEAANVSAELVRRAGLVFGFTVAASAIVSAVASWWFATIGGDHRNDSVDLSSHIFYRRKANRK